MNDFFQTLTQTAIEISATDTSKEAAELLANRIVSILNASKAALIPIKGRKRILALSGGLKPSQDNEFSNAINELRNQFAEKIEPFIVVETSLTPKMQNAQNLLKNMSKASLLWAPLGRKGKAPEYALLIERSVDIAWQQEEIETLFSASPILFSALSARRSKRVFIKKNIVWFITAAIIFFMLPVYSQVTAPVQVVPENPYYIFAPFEGIIKTLHVSPGQAVKKGDLIFSYDTAILENKRNEAVLAVASAKAEMMRLEGASYSDDEAGSKIPEQKVIVEKKESEVRFIESLLELSHFKSPSNGVVILDDPDALIGAYLRAGQLVLRIAEPSLTKLRIMVPVSDVGLIRDGAKAIIRLDSDPFFTMQAVIKHIGFDVSLSEQHIPSVIVEASWKEKSASINSGQRGAASIRGKITYLWMQLFRKPLITLRTFVGI